MNISVIDCNGIVSCRPDTTLEFEDRDFYIPDGIESIGFAPVIFIRMNRAGKCIDTKFAGRYYEAVCPGVLLYAEGHPSAALFDHSSIVPHAFYSKHTLSEESNVFEVISDGTSVFEMHPSEELVRRLDAAVASCSSVMSQRTGDLIAVELKEAATLCCKESVSSEISGSWCGNSLFSRRIIF